MNSLYLRYNILTPNNYQNLVYSDILKWPILNTKWYNFMFLIYKKGKSSQNHLTWALTPCTYITYTL